MDWGLTGLAGTQLVGPDVTPFTVEKQSLLLDAWKPLGLADPSLNILWRRVLAFRQINSTAIEVALVFVQALPSGPGSPGTPSRGSSPGGTPLTTVFTVYNLLCFQLCIVDAQHRA